MLTGLLMPSVRITHKFSGNGDPRAWVKSMVEKIESRNQQLFTEAMGEGKEIMRDNIETRGTAHSGKRGRIEESKMLGATTSEVTSPAKNRMSGRFGWLNTQEDYFLYQEGGFRHVRAGRMVEGMYAMQDAADEVWMNLREDLERSARGA